MLCSAPGKDGLQLLHHLTEICIPPALVHIAEGLVLANIVNKAKKKRTNRGMNTWHCRGRLISHNVVHYDLELIYCANSTRKRKGRGVNSKFLRSKKRVGACFSGLNLLFSFPFLLSPSPKPAKFASAFMHIDYFTLLFFVILQTKNNP